MSYTLLYETLHGSRAYGLAREGSDTDYKGVIVGPARWYHGFLGGPEQVELSADHVLYELRKLFRLAAQGNPSVLEILFTDPEDHRCLHPAGARLLALRDRFLSRRVEGSFGGYALAQLKRIKTHRRWLMNPPEAAPKRAAFGLPERSAVPADQLGALGALDALGSVADVGFLDLLGRERAYRAAEQEWRQYQTWLRERNPKRAALEAHHGFDTKHALHLVRLLKMGAEILETGVVRVRRPDREELLAIRDGALSYDQLMALADTLAARIKQAALHSSLPERPDDDGLDQECAELIAFTLKEHP